MQPLHFDPARRRFLGLGAALAGVHLAPFLHASWPARSLFSRSEEDELRRLVVLQLAGGNDGLSTVVPHSDDLYHAARPTLRVPAQDVLRLDDRVGLHPLLGGLRRVFDQGKLAIVQGVGYPVPNRSHFASFDIWHAASLDGRTGGEGWLARTALALAQREGKAAEPPVHVGEATPYSMYSTRVPSVSFSDPALYAWEREGENIGEISAREKDADGEMLQQVRSTYRLAAESSEAIRASVARYRPRAEYPRGALGAALRTAAALVQEGAGHRILSVELAGFDTHANERPKHEMLLGALDGALTAFLADLAGTPRGDRTVVLVFSEFGRRVAENASHGTDHGAAGPLFVAGAPVRGGLIGEHPSLATLDEGDLIHAIDFRSAYATLAESWLGVDSEALLGARYPLLPLLA